MIGLWIAYNLSVTTVCLECLIGALLLALAHWTGRCAAAKSKTRICCYSPQTNEFDLIPPDQPLVESTTALVQEQQSASRQSVVNLKPGIASEFLGKDCVQHGKHVDMPPEFADKGVKIAWPFLVDFAMHILKDVILPAIQQQIPSVLGCQVEVDESTDIGSITPTFTQLVAVPISKVTKTEGTVKNVRILASVTYSGDAKVSLNFNMMNNTMVGALMGSLTHVRVGVEEVKVTGLVVIELVSMTWEPPFFGGLRIYFANPPSVDLKLNGGLSSMLNLSYIKSTVLDVVQSILGMVMVMPNQLVIPVDTTMDIWTFAGERPDGVLTVKVLNCSEFMDPDTWVGLELGGEKYQTRIHGGRRQTKNKSSGQPDNDADEFVFLVGDMYSQCLMLTTFEEEGSSLLGVTWQGDALEQCDILVSDLLKSSKALFAECWCVFSDATAKGSNGRPILTTMSPSCHNKAGVKLRVTWQNVVRRRDTSPDLFTHQDREKALLLVGIDTLYNVPVENNESRKYWVTVTKQAGTADPTHPEASEPVCEKVSGHYSAHCTDRVCWQNPLLFFVDHPERSTIKLTAQSSTGDGEIQTIGTVTKVIAPHLAKEVYQGDFEESFQVGTCEMKLKFTTRLWSIGPEEKKHVPRGSVMW